jgi:hypothetical protein
MIEKIDHIVANFKDAAKFHNVVLENVSRYQNEGLEVEIKYSQSDELFSALIIGRKAKNINTATNITVKDIIADDLLNKLADRIQEAISKRSHECIEE